MTGKFVNKEEYGTGIIPAMGTGIGEGIVLAGKARNSPRKVIEVRRAIRNDIQCKLNNQLRIRKCVYGGALGGVPWVQG